MSCTKSRARCGSRRRVAAALTTVLALAACGGGTSTSSSAGARSAGLTPTGTANGGITGSALPAGVVALPTFHMAAVTPPPPSGVDVGGTNASSRQAPVTVPLSVAAASIDTARLTPAGHRRPRAVPAGGYMNLRRLNAWISSAPSANQSPRVLRAAKRNCQ